MDIAKKILGPKSKYDKRLPYSFEARVDVLAGQGKAPVDQHWFSETLCGLIEILDAEGIAPAQARLFGVYRKEQTPMDPAPCMDAQGAWLQRPELCRSLEAYYVRTGDERYRGHREHDACDYEDRDRKGIAPY
jgi:hypothetical protein